MVDYRDPDLFKTSIDEIETVGNKRTLDQEEIRDVCSASSQLFPDGVFAKAIKVLIWQGELLRGIAKSAVQTELRSVLELAREENENKRRRCAESDTLSPAVTEEESKSRQIDMDDFLAPSCRTCGLPKVDWCTCTGGKGAATAKHACKPRAQKDACARAKGGMDTSASSANPQTQSKQGAGPLEQTLSASANSKSGGRTIATPDDGRRTPKQSDRPASSSKLSTQTQHPSSSRAVAAEEEKVAGNGGVKETVSKVGGRGTSAREPSARQRERRAAGKYQEVWKKV
eukprot:CAMPEP_0196742574 /NCGR_PEP_ID=MMETSP1091-20130531/47683_1 /TAXON_ID=302021 /ORGANISM="Rhodomonas sp., Strain CCMP768" /LENGTH=285 /DNA_ID=CAMNT_0042088661 /DNA_START=188 /DNA_END=1045 /DNA_ORIENTATION=+